MKRSFQILICLFLVCTLVLGPPLRAHATGGVVAGSTQLLPVVAGPAGAIVGLILIGLGIYALSESDDWDNLCDTIGNALTGTYVTYIDGNPYITMAQHGSEYYVDQQAVADVLAKAQQSGTINKHYIIDVEGLADVRQTTLDYLTTPRNYTYTWAKYFLFVQGTTGSDVLYLCQEQPIIYGTTSARLNPKSYDIWLYADGTHKSYSYTLDVMTVKFNGRAFTSGALKYAPTSTVYELGELGLALTDEVYTDWAANAITVPKTGTGSETDENEKTHHYPVINPARDPSRYSGYTNTDSYVNTGEQIEVDSDTLPEVEAGSDVVAPGADAGVLEWLASIWSIIAGLPAAIAEAFAAVLFPSEDFLTAKVEAIRAKFSFVDGFLGFFDAFSDAVTSSAEEVPVIWIDLGAAEGGWYWGGKVKVLDLTWYRRYKPTGDALMSGALWAMFLWRTARKLPGIISGASGGFSLGRADRGGDDE